MSSILRDTDKLRHRCMIYSGAPTTALAKLAGAVVAHLNSNYRCLYLNSPKMVDGMRAYLTAAGVNVADEVFKKRLILSSDQSHLLESQFEPRRMIEAIKTAYEQSLAEGYTGLWASGDILWELGPARDFSQLLEYERALERLFVTLPMLHGVCQYHVDILPANAAEVGRKSHRAIFVDEALSKLNPQYQAG
jgi:hypothetical protein